jgi:hypothetical protein
MLQYNAAKRGITIVGILQDGLAVQDEEATAILCKLDSVQRGTRTLHCCAGLPYPALAFVGMLADDVAVRRCTTREGALPHELRPADIMPGFPILSRNNCKNGDKAIGTSPS